MWTWSLIGPDGAPADDFSFDDRGQLVRDDTVATALALALDHVRGRWWADPDHGSRIAALLAGAPVRDTAAEVETAVREALAPLERAGRIRDVQIDVRAGDHRAHVTVTVFDVGTGAPVTVEVQPL